MNNTICNILIVVLLYIILLILWYNNRKSIVKKIILYLVLEAEDIYGSKMGNIKHAWVYSKIYPKLPSIIKAFVSADQINIWINDSVIRLDRLLHEKLESGARDTREALSMIDGADIDIK